MKFSSKLIQDAVDSFSQLPGIGRKSAIRMVLHLLKKDQTFTKNFTEAIAKMRSDVKECSDCHNISDEEKCSICNDPSRLKSTICVVESIRDVMAIEETQQYSGLYHVLGGVISPLEGIGPEKLHIESLIDRVSNNDQINEVIIAISPTIEGETTIYYLSKRLADSEVSISQLARGISFGGELEYADELTLGRSIIDRTPYQLKQSI
jgi:recombination protein RecR